jgi:hypothetical protein
VYQRIMSLDLSRPREGRLGRGRLPADLRRVGTNSRLILDEGFEASRHTACKLGRDDVRERLRTIGGQWSDTRKKAHNLKRSSL